MTQTDDPLTLGMAALTRTDWLDARAHFEAAVVRHETAAALEGLSDALYWLDDIAASLDARARAYALHRQAGDLCAAARAALWLAWGFHGSCGDAAIGRGWIQRGERLVAQAGDCVERGWYLQMRSKTAPEAATAAQLAREACDVARAHHDADLELWALSQQGRALVSMGHFDEGMALLDDAATAAIAGEARNLVVVGDVCCNMLSACNRAADFNRAAQWCCTVDAFARRHQCTLLLHYCRVVYSDLLMATGRWADAERELRTVLPAIERAHPAQRVYSLNRLALLCVRQGRLEEAEQLLAGFESQGTVAETTASLYLARGQAALARVALERRLDSLGDDLAAVPLLHLLVEAGLLLEDLEAARSASAWLSAVAERSERPSFQALAMLAAARVQAAGGERDASALFGRAVTELERLGLPFDAAVARLDWARALAHADRDVAAEDARLALLAFGQLGARMHADRAAALLRTLGVRTRPGPRVAGDLTQRELEVLEVLKQGLSNAEIGTRLFISAKTVEHHVSRILGKLGVRTRAEAIARSARIVAAKTPSEASPPRLTSAPLKTDVTAAIERAPGRANGAHAVGLHPRRRHSETTTRPV